MAQTWIPHAQVSLKVDLGDDYALEFKEGEQRFTLLAGSDEIDIGKHNQAEEFLTNALAGLFRIQELLGVRTKSVAPPAAPTQPSPRTLVP